MKIYDKKRLLLGMALLLLGATGLIGKLYFSLDIKGGIFWSVILIIFGLLDCIYYFSKKKTVENFIEKNDERNKSVILTSKAKALDLLQIVFFVGIIFGAIAWKQTGNSIFSGILIMSGFSILFSTIIEIITTLYYENKL